MKKKIIIDSIEALSEIATELQTLLVNQKVVGLYGEIGAGKTTLVKVLCRQLGSNNNVNSPTFGLVNEYEAAEDLIYHLDLYRLKNIDEAIGIGIEDYLYSDSICLVEWPELIEDLLPEDVIRVYIETMENEERQFTIIVE